MRFPVLVALLILPAAPAFARQLGARTAPPDAMIAQMNPTSPEEEIRQLAIAADAHPLGTVENPVRVGGPEGEHAYLGHLRCPDGSTPTVGARREVGIGAFGSVVAAYDVTCGGIVGRIVFDMYHEEHVETRAPAGFTFVP